MVICAASENYLVFKPCIGNSSQSNHLQESSRCSTGWWRFHQRMSGCIRHVCASVDNTTADCGCIDFALAGKKLQKILSKVMHCLKHQSLQRFCFVQFLSLLLGNDSIVGRMCYQMRPVFMHKCVPVIFCIYLTRFWAQNWIILQRSLRWMNLWTHGKTIALRLPH